jgi:hypothetical protein
VPMEWNEFPYISQNNWIDYDRYKFSMLE